MPSSSYAILTGVQIKAQLVRKWSCTNLYPRFHCNMWPMLSSTKESLHVILCAVNNSTRWTRQCCNFSSFLLTLDLHDPLLLYGCLLSICFVPFRGRPHKWWIIWIILIPCFYFRNITVTIYRVRVLIYWYTNLLATGRCIPVESSYVSYFFIFAISVFDSLFLSFH